MSTLKDFGDTAKEFSKNPLGIIALFIVLIYGFAALVVGASSELQPNERYPIVWFMVIFPVIVLVVFSWLVSCHYEKLYAPRDYNSDDAFLRALQDKKEARPALKELDRQIEEKVKSVLNSDSLLSNMGSNSDLQIILSQAAESITSQIRSSSFITVDARSFTGSDNDVYEFPTSAFSSLNDLTNEIYYQINHVVGPFEYGYSWVIKNSKSGEVIKNARMITGTKPGIPLKDERTLSEVGIEPGIVLEIVRPNKG